MFNPSPLARARKGFYFSNIPGGHAWLFVNARRVTVVPETIPSEIRFTDFIVRDNLYRTDPHTWIAIRTHARHCGVHVNLWFISTRND